MTKVASTTDKAEAHFSDGSNSEFDWIIAADGVGSTTRKQLHIDYPGADLPGKWSIADVDLIGDFDPEEITLDLYGRDNQFTLILPIEKHRARIASSTEDALATMRLPLNVEKVRRTATFQILIRQAETYRKNRILLAGDAAHCHSPVGGKGMNLGMADAIAAASSIVGGRVDQYSDLRRKAGALICSSSDLI
ncbi:FAD-dependent oxidoreductase [Microbulbifer epialgicus]|uniref:FAD-dependent oxidoreductase n=1 Tax=Microbulbifer epialgicus TaxID=393907 RepID=A0ABV4P616_9GAMM